MAKLLLSLLFLSLCWISQIRSSESTEMNQKLADPESGGVGPESVLKRVKRYGGDEEDPELQKALLASFNEAQKPQKRGSGKKWRLRLWTSRSRSTNTAVDRQKSALRRQSEMDAAIAWSLQEEEEEDILNRIMALSRQEYEQRAGGAKEQAMLQKVRSQSRRMPSNELYAFLLDVVPECLTRINSKSGIFSLGVLILEMLAHTSQLQQFTQQNAIALFVNLIREFVGNSFYGKIAHLVLRRLDLEQGVRELVKSAFPGIYDTLEKIFAEAKRTNSKYY